MLSNRRRTQERQQPRLLVGVELVPQAKQLGRPGAAPGPGYAAKVRLADAAEVVLALELFRVAGDGRTHDDERAGGSYPTPVGLALAKARGLVLLTDERKARKRATSIGVEVLTTPDVVRAWSDGVDGKRVAEAVQRIGQLARYMPSQKDQLYEWWMEHAGR